VGPRLRAQTRTHFAFLADILSRHIYTNGCLLSSRLHCQRRRTRARVAGTRLRLRKVSATSISQGRVEDATEQDARQGTLPYSTDRALMSVRKTAGQGSDNAQAVGTHWVKSVVWRTLPARLRSDFGPRYFASRRHGRAASQCSRRMGSGVSTRHVTPSFEGGARELVNEYSGIPISLGDAPR